MTTVDALGPDDPRRIGGHDLLGRLGAGGMGLVYLARTPAGRRVVVKVVHAHLAQDPEFRTRFRREVAAAARVGGRYTARVLAADPEADQPWMVTEYVPGKSLDEVLRTSGPLGVAALLPLVAGIARALRSIHAAGVVHRDLKPSNVMLGPDGPRVIDFGVARAQETGTVTGTGLAVGTVGFMSPEQLDGKPVSGASDVFSLGVLAFVAATGTSPFGTDDPLALMYRVVHDEPDLSGIDAGQLRELVAACLRKDPADRPTPEQVLARLGTDPADDDAAADPDPDPNGADDGGADTPTVLVPAPGRSPGRRTVLAGTGLLALGVAAAAVVATTQGRTTSGAPTTAGASAGPTSPAPTSPAPSSSPSASATPSGGTLLPGGRRLTTVTSWLPHANGVTSLCYSPDGSALVTAGTDAVRVWDVDGAAPTLLREFPLEGVFDVKATSGPNGLIAIDKDDNATLVVDARSGAVRRTIKQGVESLVSVPSFSRRGDLLLARFAVRDLASGKRLREAAYASVFSPAADTQLSVDDRTAEVLDARTGRRLRSFTVPHRADDYASALAVSADGRHAVVGTWQEGVWFLDLVRGVARHGSGPPPAKVLRVACSRDGALVLSVEATGTLLWDGRTAAVLHPLTSDIGAFAWAPNRAEYAAGSVIGPVTLHRVV